MKKIDLTRPDKIILDSLNSLVNLPKNLYSDQKSKSKGTGEITFIGKKKIQEVKTRLYIFDEQSVEKRDDVKTFEFFKKADHNKVHWLNFDGLHEVELIKKLGDALSLDRMTIRHALDTTFRPKVEEYDHYLFFSIKSILQDENDQLMVEQLSFILGDHYVVSLQEEEEDHFDHIRNKISEKLGLVRTKGPDFLLYQLLDAILDNYFETIDAMNKDIGDLEKVVLSHPSQKVLVQLEHMKQQADIIKKSLSPFKDALRVITNRDMPLIEKENGKYFSELMSTCSGAIEEISSVSNSLESLTNIYFSSLSQKMNETMKVLTTVSTIFIPLTFIAGIYGMNFHNMPELEMKNGYFIVLGVMGGIFLAMLYYFKRRGWL